MLKPLKLRIDDGAHRQATWLELLFDLAFVLCVSALAHLLIESPDAHGVRLYFLLLLPVWWIWNQYTWYSSHFDNDDAVFRLIMLAGIGGTLYLVRGIHAVGHGHATELTLAYIFLHIPLVVGWTRAYLQIKEFQSYERLKLLGLALGIGFWTAALVVPHSLQGTLMAIGTGLQMLMPIFAWATVKKAISVHHHHLHERHGLFVIILLGECLVMITKGLVESPVLEFGRLFIALLIVFGIWWIYFDRKYGPVDFQSTARAFAYNYGHLIVYGGIGLVAAGIGIGSGSFFIGAGLVMFLGAHSALNWLSRSKTK